MSIRKRRINLRNATAIPVYWRVDDHGTVRRIGPAETSTSNEKNMFDNPTVHVFRDEGGRPSALPIYSRTIGILWFRGRKLVWTGSDVRDE